MPIGIYRHKSTRPDWVKQKISRKMTGRSLSFEHRQALGLAHIGKQTCLGKKYTSEHKQKMREARIRYMCNVANRQRISQKMKQLFIDNPDQRKECARAFLGKHHTEETKIKLHKTTIAYLASGGWKNIKPTKLEVKVDNLLQKLLPNEYKFVGNGYTWIVGKCPDFLNIDGQKKLIEVFGDYVHKGETGADRIIHFKKYGFDTLLIWENELKDIENLSKRILAFNKR